jgi:hypothetical protein
MIDVVPPSNYQQGWLITVGGPQDGKMLIEVGFLARFVSQLQKLTTHTGNE